MKTIIPFMTFFILAGCSQEPTQVAASMAAQVNAIAPKSLGNGMFLYAAEAKGTILALTFTGVPDLYALSDEQAKRANAAMICSFKGYRNIVEQGVDLEVHVTFKSNRILPPIDIKECT